MCLRRGSSSSNEAIIVHFVSNRQAPRCGATQPYCLRFMRAKPSILQNYVDTSCSGTSETYHFRSAGLLYNSIFEIESPHLKALPLAVQQANCCDLLTTTRPADEYVTLR
jgi:hypothetical protein